MTAHRTLLVWFVAATMAMIACGSAAAEEPTAAPQPVPDEEIARLIEQLGAESFAVRQAATEKLLKIGKPTRELLVRAKSSPSVEVRSRAAALLKQIDERPLEEEILRLAQQPETKIDLEQGMWLISRIVNPDVQREELTKPLDALAARVRERLGKDVTPKTADPQQVVAALRAVLFDDEKFTGNVDDYENPGNSSLEKVLATRRGLPILLSHVVVAVGERLEVPFVGVPTPGRYIVKYEGRRAPVDFARTDIYLNPFDGGKVLSREDREQMFPGLDPDKLVEPGTKRAALIRMLTNLETHLFNRDETDRAYQALAFRLALEQHTPQDRTP